MRNFLFIFFFLLSFRIFCVDVSFWKPYISDTGTYCLLHFDKDDFTDFEGKIKGINKIGEIYFEKNGRFGGALKLKGKGAIQILPREKYIAKLISLEAWIKLEKYPEDKGFIIYRPSSEKSNGFKIYIDSKGALYFETSTPKKKIEKLSTDEGVIKLNEWVHIACVSLGTLWNTQLGMRIFVNGKQVAFLKDAGGLEGEEEISPIYIGNDENLENGFNGLIDEIRIQNNVFRFWEKENDEWIEENKNKPVIIGKPYFVNNPSLYISFDNNEIKNGVRINFEEKNFVDGVKKRACKGEIHISNEKGIINSKQGCIVFWYQPYKMNNWNNWNFSIMEAKSSTKNFWFKLHISPDITKFPKPLTISFPNVGDKIGGFGVPVDIYEGRWFQFVINWCANEISLYINGKLQGKNIGGFGFQESIFFDDIKFTNGIFDEIFIYDKPLNEDEVQNAYWMYVNEGNLKKDVSSLPAKGYFYVLPGMGKIYYQIVPYQVSPENIEKVKISLIDENGKVVLSKEEKFEENEKTIEIGEIKQGNYTILFSVKDNKSDDFKEIERKKFERKIFPWEGNNLGITDKVFPPFEPVRVEGNRVKIVLREYEMNEFGLWNKVLCKGKNILAEPIEIKGLTEKQEIKWIEKKGEFIEKKENRCIYKGSVVSEILNINTKSTVEFDGCMRVEMEILPGLKREKIEKMYIEIPIKEEFAKLLHAVITGPRSNYAGKMPDGEGIIWSPKKIKRAEPFSNTFVPYIWIGKEEEGIAWFGENDKGYITDKNPYNPNEANVIQEIDRKGGKVILRIYIINVPAFIDEPKKIIFGLQASPTKPMPNMWRKRLPELPGGLPVHPWANFSPSNKGPYYDDWEVIDRIIEGRYGGGFDEKWFEERLKSYVPPPQDDDYNRWLRDVKYSYEKCKRAGPNKPVFCYHEEMMVNTAEEAFHTFIDEWTNCIYWPREKLPRVRSHGWSTAVSFPKSYQDYGVWYANEWLKRGISLYWDNTWFQITYNYRVSDAYKFEYDGREFIQPCFNIWNEREYFKRVWNLLCYWREKRKEPLEWTVHMTNTLLLPIHTFATINLDNEWILTKPLSPDLLRTESIGLQVGNYPLCLFPISGEKNENLKNLDRDRKLMIEWGMRAVHEIQRVRENDWGYKICKDLEKIITEFGYGEEKVSVYNYWSENPFITVDNEEVKWIVLEDMDKKDIMMIFSSWSTNEIELEVKINKEDYENRSIIDVLSGEKVGVIKNQKIKVKLWAPYGMKILKTEK